MHVVRKIPEAGVWEVAVCQSGVQSLLENGFPFHEGRSGFYFVQPTKQETEIYGIQGAKQRVYSRFVQNAVEGIRSGRGRGLDQYYRNHQMYRQVARRIESEILIRDIEVSVTSWTTPRLNIDATQKSDEKVLGAFLVGCVFLGLHLLDDFDSECALEVCGRDREAWTNHFQELLKDDLEMHELSLLRGLLESAEGKVDVVQRQQLDLRRSAMENLAAFNSLLGTDGRSALFGIFDPQKMREALLNSEVFQGGELDVERLKTQMLRYLPIGFSGVAFAFPPSLTYGTNYAMMTEFRFLR